MKRPQNVIALTITLLATGSGTGWPQEIPDGRYFGQSPPGMTPEIFAPDIISLDERYEYILTFSPDLDECVFGETDRFWSYFTLFFTSMSPDSSWIDPIAAPFQGDGDGLIPAYSPDGNTIFFVSSRPGWPGANIFYSTRNDSGWDEPMELPSPVNTFSTEFGLSLANDETLYFTSDRSSGYGQQDIYSSTPVGGEYTSVENLGPPINSNYNEASPFIAPDGSYLIFESNKPGGYGQVDIYLSMFEDGSWTEPVNLGPDINTNQIDDAASVSPDGKYFFFNRREAYNTQVPTDIYWVDIRAVFPDVSVETDGTGRFPRSFEMSQNYPNPFNPSTVIDYVVPEGIDVPVSLYIFDIHGRRVRNLVNRVRSPGRYSVHWDGRDMHDSRAASGIYYYRLQAGDFTSTRKMILLY